MFDLAMVWLAYETSKEILQSICDYTHQQYLTILEDQLKRARLLYEQGTIGEEEYKKLETELTTTMKSLRTQLASRLGRRQLDVKLI